ncbi:hypothetical protein [Acinetobacter sp. YH12219]|uniref:hypothetical protein n=1 Tax=Acinetobacter sp. YH12219 TaxID=2601153 RepID=UPI0015D44CE0|nr:hypothetical protein [Acinetobacter sp. YH12219]
MGLGYGVGAGGFLIICFAILVLFIVIAIWLSWNNWYKKQKNRPYKVNAVLKIGLSGVLFFPLFVAVTLGLFVISDLSSDYAEWQHQKKIHIQLQEPLNFGEVVLPEGTWINRSFETDYTLEQMTDIRQGLTSARFPQPIQIAGFDVIAFELHRHLLLELAHDQTVMMNNQKVICPAGWLLELGGSGYPSTAQRYSLNFDWFTPSRWQPINCFDGEGIIVLKSKDFS